MRALLPLMWALFWIGRTWAAETATAVASVAQGKVSSVTVISAGSGYGTLPKVTITGGGGTGASAMAVLAGDKVAAIVVLTPGSGYTTIPDVVIEAPPKDMGVALRMVPELTVSGPVGSAATVQWAADLAGPWNAWTNVFVGESGVVVVDLSAGATTRFYRAIPNPQPPGPAGFVWIPPGTFGMGSPAGEDGRSPDEVQHVVTITRGFWISGHEVTQAEYQAVTGTNPASMEGDPSQPVEQVSWDDAVAYCQKLTENDRATGRITSQQAYRLPTEAEWEYAARAGSTGARHGEINSIAWWSGNAGGRTRPVGQKTSNAWGLHDVMGNVWEWCADWYAPYDTGNLTDPSGATSGAGRVYGGVAGCLAPGNGGLPSDAWLS